MGDQEETLPLPKGKKKNATGLPWIFDQLQSNRPPPGQQYRESTLGRTLQESIAELIAKGKMTETLGESILLHFDAHVAAHLERCGVQAKFTTGAMTSFKEVSHSYDFVLEDVEISSRGGRTPFNVSVDKVRVRALPSIKLLKKNALKKTRKGEAYDASKREREEGKEKLYEVINDDDEEMADE